MGTRQCLYLEPCAICASIHVCSPPAQLGTIHWLAALWQADTSIASNACSD